MIGSDWVQRTIRLSPRPRGVHLVTEELLGAVPEIDHYRVGLAHLFLQHTSASLSINENADPDVRIDLESFLQRIVPDGAPYFRHVLEGPDDMPAHVRSVILGSSLTIPIEQGRFALGTWQGIYLCEHRVTGSDRTIVVTLHGQRRGGLDE